ncbi:hypothetical protein [Massilia sp. DWR3-1-1]|uniref:hypothetical protein n=1 Tax=Massilia sp. DWR3-1-1 TaxID=2804559 RepID=UPI003CEB51C4
MPANRAFLHSIDYAAGCAVPVAGLIDHGIAVETVDELLHKGVQAFARLARPLDQVIADCVQGALDKSGLRGDAIDSVILVTESFAELFDDGRTALSFRQIRNRCYDLFYGLGITRAVLLCATYGGCTNFLQASLLASSLVQQGLARQVLLVAAERFATLESRLMDEAVSIAGDGVAACVVSAAPPAGTAFRLDFIGMSPYKNIVPGADMAARLLEMFRSMKHAAADCYDACRMQPGDFRWVVLGDYNRSTTLTYSRLLGFPPQRAFLENVGQLGHIPFDPLINLADLQHAQLVGDTDAVLLFLCGPLSCGAVAVTTCQ